MSLINPKNCLSFAAAYGAAAVALGAFGAHALKHTLSPKFAQVYQTAVHYHFYHALALLALAILLQQRPASRGLKWSGAAFILGIPLFAGSLYSLALTQWTWLGAITPLGGLCFVAGWLSMLWAVLKEW